VIQAQFKPSTVKSEITSQLARKKMAKIVPLHPKLAKLQENTLAKVPKIVD